MGVAFEMARAALRVTNRDDVPDEQFIADKIIDLAKTGVRDPEALCDGALKSRESTPEPKGSAGVS